MPPQKGPLGTWNLRANADKLNGTSLVFWEGNFPRNKEATTRRRHLDAAADSSRPKDERATGEESRSRHCRHLSDAGHVTEAGFPGEWPSSGRSPVPPSTQAHLSHQPAQPCRGSWWPQMWGHSLAVLLEASADPHTPAQACSVTHTAEKPRHLTRILFLLRKNCELALVRYELQKRLLPQTTLWLKLESDGIPGPGIAFRFIDKSCKRHHSIFLFFPDSLITSSSYMHTV